MATQTHRPAQIGFTSVKLGAATVALAGVGLIATTAEGLQRANPQLYHYISHLQVALSGFMIGLGIAVSALAWFGIRNGVRWALWSAFLALLVGTILAHNAISRSQ